MCLIQCIGVRVTHLPSTLHSFSPSTTTYKSLPVYFRSLTTSLVLALSLNAPICRMCHACETLLIYNKNSTYFNTCLSHIWLYRWFNMWDLKVCVISCTFILTHSQSSVCGRIFNGLKQPCSWENRQQMALVCKICQWALTSLHLSQIVHNWTLIS